MAPGGIRERTIATDLSERGHSGMLAAHLAMTGRSARSAQELDHASIAGWCVVRAQPARQQPISGLLVGTLEPRRPGLDDSESSMHLDGKSAPSGLRVTPIWR